MIQYFPIVTGSLVVLGNVSVSGSINASGSVTISGSIASASYALSASNAATASSADNFLTRGTLTAQTIVVQTITSSIDFVTGSTRFGSLSSNTHVFTGSMSVSGSGTFIGNVTAGDVIRVSGSGAYFTISDTQASSRNWAIRAGHDAVGDLAIRQSNSAGGDPVSAGTNKLYISAAGAATFSGSVTAANGIFNMSSAVPSPTGISAWDSTVTTFGGSTTTSNALAIGFNTANNASYILSAQPTVAWRGMWFGASEYRFTVGQAATPSLIISSSGAATFSSLVTATGFKTNGLPNGLEVVGPTGNPAYVVTDQAINNSGKRWRFGHTGGAAGFNSFDIYNQTDNLLALTISSTGAATFSSGVTTNGTINVNGGYAININTQNGFQVGADAFSAGFYVYDNTNSQYRMVIKNGGNVLIGTTTDNGYKLRVNGTLAVDSAIYSLRSSGNVFNIANISGNEVGKTYYAYGSVAMNGGKFRLAFTGVNRETSIIKITVAGSWTASNTSSRHFTMIFNVQPLVDSSGNTTFVTAPTSLLATNISTANVTATSLGSFNYRIDVANPLTDVGETAIMWIKVEVLGSHYMTSATIV